MRTRPLWHRCGPRRWDRAVREGAYPGPVPSTRTLAATALVTGGIGIGITEFVTMGLLPQIAEGVGVDIPTAGHTI